MNWELIGKVSLLLFVVALFVLWGVIMFKWWKSDRDWFKAAWADLAMRKEQKRKNQEDFDRSAEKVRGLAKGQTISHMEMDEIKYHEDYPARSKRYILNEFVSFDPPEPVIPMDFGKPLVTDVLDGEGEYLFRVAEDETYKNAVEKNA